MTKRMPLTDSPEKLQDITVAFDNGDSRSGYRAIEVTPEGSLDRSWLVEGPRGGQYLLRPRDGASFILQPEDNTRMWMTAVSNFTTAAQVVHVSGLRG